MVYSEIDESFTGDSEALIEYLLLKNPGYAASFDNSVVKYNGSNFADATNSIVQLIDLQVHPQIFIPNYDVLKEQNILGKNDPVVIFYAGDESITDFPGYKISDGRIIKIKTQVDESFSLKNEVWVISINERYFGSIADIDINKQKNQKVKGQEISTLIRSLLRRTLKAGRPEQVKYILLNMLMPRNNCCQPKLKLNTSNIEVRLKETES